MPNELIRAALVVARTECVNDTGEPGGYAETRRVARAEVRRVLDSMGITWREPQATDAEEDGA